MTFLRVISYRETLSMETKCYLQRARANLTPPYDLQNIHPSERFLSARDDFFAKMAEISPHVKMPPLGP